MKVGDLVRDNYPTRDRVGVIVEQVHDRLAQNNKCYNVLWRDGTIGKNVWDYDLKVYNAAG